MSELEPTLREWANEVDRRLDTFWMEFQATTHQIQGQFEHINKCFEQTNEAFADLRKSEDHEGEDAAIWERIAVALEVLANMREAGP